MQQLRMLPLDYGRPRSCGLLSPVSPLSLLLGSNSAPNEMLPYYPMQRCWPILCPPRRSLLSRARNPTLEWHAWRLASLKRLLSPCTSTASFSVAISRVVTEKTCNSWHAKPVPKSCRVLRRSPRNLANRAWYWFATTHLPGT